MLSFALKTEVQLIFIFHLLATIHTQHRFYKTENNNSPLISSSILQKQQNSPLK